MGDTALSLPPNPDDLEIIRLDAKYVLVVEKDAIFQRLNREGFWNSEKCLLVTAKGMPG
jgi:DNA topoisomerase VI, subunit A